MTRFRPDVGGMHVRIDGLDAGERTLEVTLFERWDSEPVSTQRVSFDVPENIGPTEESEDRATDSSSQSMETV